MATWLFSKLGGIDLYMQVRPTLLRRIALVSFLLFRTNLGNLGEFFGQMVYPPPRQKIARTPMGQSFLLKGILRIWQIRPIFVFRICFLCKSDRQTDPCKLPFRSYIIISDTL